MSNLPPGVTESMIPGNRPEDIEYEKFWQDMEATNLLREEWVDDDNFINLIDWIITRVSQKSYQQGIDDAKLEVYYQDEI